MTAPRPPTAQSFLARLKAETRSEHEAIEAALGLVERPLTRVEYRLCLERFYGFYRPVEERLEALGDWPRFGVVWEARRKVPLLATDLRSMDVEPEHLPQCPDLPPCDDRASCFGVLYVLEGATLGGTLISRHLAQTLRITPEGGGRFFAGYGGRTREMWLSFQAALASFAEHDGVEGRIVEAAIDTFRRLRSWAAPTAP